MTVRILEGDCRAILPTLAAGSVQCCVTSPPYFGLRDYGHASQLGLEDSPAAYVAAMVEVFREVRRVLADDGTVWLNLGDSYVGGGGYSPNSPSNLAGSKQSAQRGCIHGSIRPTVDLKAKNLIGIPWRVAFALQADGWYLRQDIIWHKPACMPESVTDRCTKSHEYVFLLAKSERYYFDAAAISEAATGRDPGNIGHKYQDGSIYGEPERIAHSGISVVGPRETRNRRSVWTIATQPYAEAHFATMAPDLARDCVLAGCPIGGTVLDPFGGAGTTGLVADRLQRDAVLIELSPTYAALALARICGDAPLFAQCDIAPGL